MTVYKFGVSWDLSDTWTWRAGYSFTDQPIPKDQMIFNILAPGVMEEHFTVGFTQTMKGGNELSLSFMYAPEFRSTGRTPSSPTFRFRPGASGHRAEHGTVRTRDQLQLEALR